MNTLQPPPVHFPRCSHALAADGSLRLVSTGGLIPRKDPLVAVGTVAELVSRGVDAHLVWLGEGPLREATVTEARRLGVEERISPMLRGPNRAKVGNCWCSTKASAIAVAGTPRSAPSSPARARRSKFSSL